MTKTKVIMGQRIYQCIGKQVINYNRKSDNAPVHGVRYYFIYDLAGDGNVGYGVCEAYKNAQYDPMLELNKNYHILYDQYGKPATFLEIEE